MSKLARARAALARARSGMSQSKIADSAIAAAAGASVTWLNYFAIDKLKTADQKKSGERSFLEKYWYISPLVLAVGGHFLKRRYVSAGTGILGAAGALMYMNYALMGTAKSASSSTKPGGVEGWPSAYMPSVASYNAGMLMNAQGPWPAGALLGTSDVNRTSDTARTSGRVSKSAGMLYDAREAFNLYQ